MSLIIIYCVFYDPLLLFIIEGLNVIGSLSLGKYVLQEMLFKRNQKNEVTLEMLFDKEVHSIVIENVMKRRIKYVMKQQTKYYM